MMQVGIRDMPFVENIDMQRIARMGFALRRTR